MERDGCLRYTHTQRGSLWLIVGGSALLFFLARVAVVAVGPVLLLLLGFGALTVSVDASEITLRCGVRPIRGWVRKRIALDTVKDHQTVRNSWLLGQGIRYIGNGWLYNVAGFEAVELDLTNGRRVRIGTDEPEALAAAIARARR